MLGRWLGRILGVMGVSINSILGGWVWSDANLNHLGVTKLPGLDTGMSGMS